MGGYGVLVNLGAGLSAAKLARVSADLGTPLQAQLLREHAAPRAEVGRSAPAASLRSVSVLCVPECFPPLQADPRVRAAVAIAPWGRNVGLWEPEALACIRAPTLFVAGSVDAVSGSHGARDGRVENASGAPLQRGKFCETQ